MKKLISIAITTLAVILSAGNPSHAAPADETADPSAEAILTKELTPELITQAIAELKTAGIPYETVNDSGGVKTVFHFEQGFSFTFVEPKPALSSFLWGGWDTGGAYILLTRTDIHLLMDGSATFIARGICALPGVGWAACLTAGIVVNRILAWIKNNNPYRCGNRQMKMCLGGRPGGCA